MAGDEVLPFFDEIDRVAQDNRNLGRMRDELRDLGLALMFSGTSTIFHGLTTDNHHVLRGFITCIAGLGLVGMSFMVHRFPRAAAMLLAVVKNFILGFILF